MIATSLPSTLGSLEEVLQRIHLSTSLEYSHSSLSLILKAKLAFGRNKDLCLHFLRCCSNYGEIMTAFRAPIALPASSRVGASDDLRERAMGPLFETPGISTESATCAHGLSSF